jgi:ABC-type nitrate/sulfonate/bicarbonate transport system substrate-binding protein
MRKARILVAATAILFGAQAAQALTEIKMITFGSASNLPIWIAQDKGFFEKEGLKVERVTTRGSTQQFQDLMDGKYQFASTAFDNIVAYAEGKGATKFDNFDVVGILGVHSGMNTVVSAPALKNWTDIRGKTISVDAVGSGYATVLYQILENKGVKRNEFNIVAVGSTQERMKTLRDGRAQMAVISSPEDIYLQRDGFNILGDAAGEIGDYQGSAYAVRRSYAQQNPQIVTAFARAIMNAHNALRGDEKLALEVLRARVKDMPDKDALALVARMRGPHGFFPDAALSRKGIENVFKLRATYTGEPPLSNLDRYVDFSWAEKAKQK